MKTIADEDGRLIFEKAYEDNIGYGKGQDVSLAYAYAALEKAGYQQIEGIWIKQSFLAKFMRIFAGLKNPEELTDELLEDIDREAKDMRRGKKTSKSDDDKLAGFTLQADVVKMEEEQRLVYGWASVIE